MIVLHLFQKNDMNTLLFDQRMKIKDLNLESLKLRGLPPKLQMGAKEWKFETIYN